MREVSGHGGEETTEDVGTAEAAGEASNDVVQISGSLGGAVTLRTRVPASGVSDNVSS
jgi:hypothetical protein